VLPMHLAGVIIDAMRLRAINGAVANKKFICVNLLKICVHLWLINLHCQEANPESRAFPDLALDKDLAAMGFYNMFDD